MPSTTHQSRLTTTYDLNSRIDTLTYPSGFSVRNNYNVYSYLNSVTRAERYLF